MSDDRLAALLEDLRLALEEERQVLLAGRPEGVHTVVQRKLALAEAIEAAWPVSGGTQPDATALARLARYNRDNSVICSAMLRHLTAALDRLRRHEPHRSYRPDGSEHNPPAPQALGAA